MSWAEEVRQELANRLGVEVEAESGFAPPTVTIPADRWADGLRVVKERGYTFFDWLSAVDELDKGFVLVCHLAALDEPGTVRHLLLRCAVSRETPRVASVVDIYAGAAWHERETHEMFGIEFTDHPGLKPLLLPDEFEGHPLRKEFVLASRVAKPWPGAKDPGESDADLAAGHARRKVAPPGVPAEEAWGPREPGSPAPDPMAAAAPPKPARKTARKAAGKTAKAAEARPTRSARTSGAGDGEAAASGTEAPDTTEEGSGGEAKP